MLSRGKCAAGALGADTLVVSSPNTMTSADSVTTPGTSKSRPMKPADQVRDADIPLELAGRDVYMIGIGGCGMSGLARMLAGRGAEERRVGKECRSRGLP